MALKGTLADLGIVEVLQFPHTGRKSGELSLSSNGTAARLFYDNGNLVHAQYKEETGIEVVIELVGWNHGEFEFTPGVLTDQRTIEQDLHRTMMLALKLRDERRREADLKRQQAEEALGKSAEALSQRIEEVLAEQSHLRFVSLIALSGQTVVTRTSAFEALDRVERICRAIAELARAYPGGWPNRVLIEEHEMNVAFTAVPDRGVLLIGVDVNTSMGALSMLLNRISGRLFAEER